MSVSFAAHEAARWCGTSVAEKYREILFSSVTIDSRNVEPGALFVAIRGPRHDGHRFVESALAAGARGLLLQSDSDSPRSPDLPILEVPDTTRALGDLAQGHRSNFDGPLVAITGSSGKTTTKDMCAAALEAEAPCLKTQGNLNNEFGLPLTLLARKAEQASAVIEMGMNHRGEIARLAEIARPGVGLVTNVGTAHIEFLGSQEAIAEEKGDLFASLPANGIAVVNLEDPFVTEQAQRTPGERLTYGFGRQAAVRATDVAFEREPESAFSFDLQALSRTEKIRVRGLGETTVINALAAAAGALAAGSSPDQVAAGLAGYRPPAGRMNPILASHGATVIDDTYNSNPESLDAALETLARHASPGRSFAILGDMNELGDRAHDEHRAAGRKVGELGIDFLFAIGQHGGLMIDAAVEAGLERKNTIASTDHDEVGAAIRAHSTVGDWILVKGSRGIHMEYVVNSILSKENR